MSKEELPTPAIGICYCGKKHESTAMQPTGSVTYDGDGNIVYMRCVHGNVIIDKLLDQIISEHSEDWKELAKS